MNRLENSLIVVPIKSLYKPFSGSQRTINGTVEEVVGVVHDRTPVALAEVVDPEMI